MKQYYLRITSKNEKSLKNFLHFFFKHLNTKFNTIQKSITTHNSRKMITLLKSPHVNKTAQEHFETRLFTKKILVKGIYLKKNCIVLKKALNKLFQDISLQFEFKTDQIINRLSIFCPDNFKLPSNKQFKTNLKRRKQKAVSKKLKLKKNVLFDFIKFLGTVSVFGEILVMSSMKY